MTQQNDEEFFKARGFGLKMGFGRNPALLVIDLIKAFTDENRTLGAQARRAGLLLDRPLR
jgi:maleamate amidohydrolase